MKKTGFGWSLHPNAFGEWRPRSQMTADMQRTFLADKTDKQTDITQTDKVIEAIETVTDKTDRLIRRLLRMSVSFFAFVGVLIFILTVGRHLLHAVNDQLTDFAAQTVLIGMSTVAIILSVGIVGLLYFILDAVVFSEFRSRKTY